MIMCEQVIGGVKSKCPNPGKWISRMGYFRCVVHCSEFDMRMELVPTNRMAQLLFERLVMRHQLRREEPFGTLVKLED